MLWNYHCCDFASREIYAFDEQEELVYDRCSPMIADSIEYGQWKTGLRTAGAIQSATTSGQKFGQGIGSVLIGFIMESNGYNGDIAVQSSHTLSTISNLFIYGVTILGVLMIIILLFYHLDKEYPKIIKELLDRESKVVLKTEK